MSECIFCKIIAGEIPCDKVYEDEHVFAFLDIAPVHKGHTLVIPKKHCSDIFDMEDVQGWALGVQKVAKAVKEAVGAPGYNLIMNNGAAAGQVVFHAHLHIIPRYDPGEFAPLPHATYAEGESAQFKAKIEAALE